jgi:hypothetical protein
MIVKESHVTSLRTTFELHRRERLLSCRGLLALACVVAAALAATVRAESVLVVPPSEARQHVTVPWPKDAETDPAGGWQCVEIGGPADAAAGVQRTAQVAADGTVADERGALLATIAPRAGMQEPRRFALRPRAEPAVASPFRFADVDNKSLQLFEGDQPLWVYNHGVITCDKVPEKDRRRTRACYVHPVWGLNGEVITDDFPADHYHHHGIFWAWPHVAIEGREYDLWTYSNIQQKFIRWLFRQTGPVAAVLAVENGWFVGDKQVLTERIWLRAFRTGEDERGLDIALVLVPGPQPVTLRGAEGKSYGGLTVRYPVWPRRDATVRAPDHTVNQSGDSLASKEDLSNTRLPWADLTAQFPGSPQRSGATVFIHPGHPDFPPTWLTRCYGCLCVGYPGVEGRTFEPGQPFRMDYRIWIHKSEADHARIGQHFEAFGSGVKAAWAADK